MILDFLYDFKFFPVILQVLPITAIVIFYILLGVPMFIWTLSVLALSFIYFIDTSIVIGLAIILTIFSIPFIRQHTVSRFIMKVAQLLKLFPKVSETERTALEAGSVWMDKELFSGAPNLKTLMSQHIQPLSKDEQAFLDGPVTQLCSMIDDWEIQRTKQIPEDVWSFIKQEKFFGMIIPKSYGGLGLSAIGHSAVIEKISSVSATVAITIMVPNSLGPAELLLHYGTDAQKERYLAKLATGEETPCFGLTEPTAGSDAGAIQSEGVVFKDDNDELMIRFNWNKRWITLSGISTVVGLAFLLKDPDQLLGGPKDCGITCALIPTKTDGIDVTKRHDPLGVPFYNCPIIGSDVVMPLSCIIGEKDGIGNGWRMLMDCLSAGRGISLPSLSSGGAQTIARLTSSFSTIRQQFGMSIGGFEGIEEPLARITAKTLLMIAARDYTCGAIDQGEKPSVVSAIMKLYTTEMFRDVVNDGMDILGGAGITQGPRNAIASAYKAAPIGITVEGANILTRTLIIFGQGALRCHPFAYDEVSAAENNNVKQFDRAFFGHIYHVIRMFVKSGIYTFSKGLLAPHYGTFLSPYKRRLMWSSSVFAIISDLSMFYFGGALKAKQKITGRLTDILSNMYLATAMMAYYERFPEKQSLIKPAVQWVLEDCFNNIQIALIGFLDNFTLYTRVVKAPLFKLFSIGRAPSDKLGKKVAQSIQNDLDFRNFLTSAIFLPDGNKDGLGKYDATFLKLIQVAPVIKNIKRAVKKRQLPKQPIAQLIPLAVEAGIISSNDAELLQEAETNRLDAIQVDAFTNDEYLKNA